MIKQLAELGAKHRIQILPDYDGKGNVTVTVITTPKDDDDPEIRKPLQISGPIEEVDAGLVSAITEFSDLTSKFTNNLEELKAETEAAVKQAKEDAAKKADAAKAKAVESNAKTKTKKPAQPAPPNGSKADDKSDKQAPQAKADASPKPKLTPAWKQAPTPPESTTEEDTKPEDLGSLFGE